MSSPDGFTLPLSDRTQDPDRAGLPVSPPTATIPVAPPSAIPVSAPSTIPVAPPPTAPPSTIPVAPPSQPASSSPSAPSPRVEDLAPVAPPSASEAGIVAVERSAGGLEEPEVPLDEILVYLLEKGGSDLHLSVNAPPMIRVHGDLEAVPGYRPLTAHQLQDAVYAILTDRQKQRFEETKELDLAYQPALHS